MLSLSFLPAIALSAQVRTEAFRSAALDAQGQLHIVLSSGKELLAPRRKYQVSFSSPLISPDGKTLGWLVNYPYPGTTSPSVDPIPQTLVLYRTGRVLRTISTGQVFWDWRFYHGSRDIAYCTGPTHGGGGECVLLDIASGHLRERWLPENREDQQTPPWAEGMNF